MSRHYVRHQALFSVPDLLVYMAGYLKSSITKSWLISPVFWKRLCYLPLLVVLMMFVTIGSLGCSKSNKSQNAGKQNNNQRPVSVGTVTLTKGTLQQTAQFVGELTSPESVQVAAEISGRLDSIVVRMGDRVSREQLLATIDDTQLKAQLSEAQAALAVAEASVRRAKAELRNAEMEYTRKKPLIDKNLITKQEIDNLQTKVDSLQAASDLSEAQLSQARARITILKTQLGHTRIVAPFPGLIEKRDLDPGAVVSPGMMIVKIVKVDPIIVSFMVGEQLIGKIKNMLSQNQTTIKIKLDAYPDEIFEGGIVRVSPVLKASNRSAEIEAELPNPEGRLMPGMYGRVSFTLEKREDVVIVPLQALLDERQILDKTDKGQKTTKQAGSSGKPGYLYVLNGDKAVLKPCIVGFDDGKYCEVISGVDEGAQVVIEGQSDLIDGRQVIVNNHDR